MRPCSTSLRAVGTHNTFFQRKDLYTVVRPLGDAQKAGKFITSQRALQSETMPYNSTSDGSAAIREITRLLHGSCSQDSWSWPGVATPAQSRKQAGLRLPSPRGGWEGTGVKTTKGAMTWEKWQELLCEGWGAVKGWIIFPAVLVNRGNTTARWGTEAAGTGMGWIFFLLFTAVCLFFHRSTYLHLEWGTGEAGNRAPGRRGQYGKGGPHPCNVVSAVVELGGGEGGQDRERAVPVLGVCRSGPAQKGDPYVYLL